MARSVAVVGAGGAGAAAATRLTDVADVTVFERRGDVGGRSRTREREGCRYETGANYLTASDERVAALIEESVPDDGLLELDGDVRPFDADGAIGDASSEGQRHVPRLTCHDGLATLTEHVLADADAEVVLETRIDELERSDGRWRLRDGEGRDRGQFDAVVLTPPAPLAADLLGRSEWPHADCREVREGIASVPYRPITTVVLHYPFELDQPWYALVNDDREHPLGWIAREDEKPGYVPDGETVLLVQCSSDFTVEHYDADAAAVVDRVGMLAAGVLDDERLAEPDWNDTHCWRYAVPREGVDSDLLARGADHHLYAAGDWVVGEDRLNGALRSGLSTGETVRENLS